VSRPLPRRRVGRIVQPDIARVMQHAHSFDGVVDDLDPMEPVKGDGGLGQPVADTLGEGRAHFDADILDRLRVTTMRDPFRPNKATRQPGSRRVVTMKAQQNGGFYLRAFGQATRTAEPVSPARHTQCPVRSAPVSCACAAMHWD